MEEDEEEEDGRCGWRPLVGGAAAEEGKKGAETNGTTIIRGSGPPFGETGSSRY